MAKHFIIISLCQHVWGGGLSKIADTADALKGVGGLSQNANMLTL